MCQGRLDCVAFTSAPAVDAPHAGADALGAYDAMLAACAPIIATVVKRGYRLDIAA